MAVNCPGCSPRFEFSLAYWFRIAVSWQAIAGQWGEGSLRGEGLIGWPLFPQGKSGWFWQFAPCLGPGLPETEGLEALCPPVWLSMPFWLKWPRNSCFEPFRPQFCRKKALSGVRRYKNRGLTASAWWLSIFVTPRG